MAVPEIFQKLSIPCDAQVLRSSCKWSSGHLHTENGGYNAYLKLIEEAQHYIYIEVTSKPISFNYFYIIPYFRINFLSATLVVRKSIIKSLKLYISASSKHIKKEKRLEFI